LVAAKLQNLGGKAQVLPPILIKSTPLCTFIGQQYKKSGKQATVWRKNSSSVATLACGT
jgi:hypothetical protein